MSEQAFKQLISGESRGVFASGGRLLLRVLSVPYGLAMTLRNMAFDVGLKPTQAADVPVIAIGNLTTGGTGKTPVVAAVVSLLQDLGHRPGIVSRGYGADKSGENDEKRVLEQLCPQVPHRQNPDRVAAVQKLIVEKNVTAIVLDDAFQHRRIQRDLNVVLIDATNPFGHGYLLPRGLLRESISGLKRADIVLITRADMASEDELTQIRAVIEKQNPALAERMIRVAFRPSGLLSHAGRQPVSEVQNRPVTVVTAIGNPEAFVDTCRQLKAEIVTSLFFPDHHNYTEKDLEQIQQHAGNAGAPMILTTLKDFVKIPACHDSIVAVQIETAFESDNGLQILRDELAAATKISTESGEPRSHGEP